MENKKTDQKTYHDYEKEKLALQLKDLMPEQYQEVVRELARRMGV